MDVTGQVINTKALMQAIVSHNPQFHSETWQEVHFRKTLCNKSLGGWTAPKQSVQNRQFVLPQLLPTRNDPDCKAQEHL